MKGVVRTRVGYAGGAKTDPTYYSLGDHTETIQIDYDPIQISYAELLDVFWDSHNPAYPAYSRQYMAIVFYHNEEQERLAIETKAREEAQTGGKVFTEIQPYSNFYLAEDYHQKYRLRLDRELMGEFDAMYPEGRDFVDSTAATRLNGYTAGYGDLATLQEELDSYGLSQEGRRKLLELAAVFFGGPDGEVC